MKTLILLLIFISYSQAQKPKDNGFLGRINFGVYGGINFETSSYIGGTFNVEFKTNIVRKLQMMISAGYSKTTIADKYNIKTYNKLEIDDTVLYSAGSYDVLAKEYGIFPLSFSIKYEIMEKRIAPYFLISSSYNLMAGKTIRSPGYVRSYNSFESIPEEFRTKHIEVFPDNSLSIGFGLGALYEITEAITLDLRYIYKIDSEIKNIHNIVLGIII